MCNARTGTTVLLFTSSLPQSPVLVVAGSWGFSSWNLAQLTCTECVSVLEVLKKLLIKELMLEVM